MWTNKRQGDACLFGNTSQDPARLVDHPSQSPCACTLHHLQISTNIKRPYQEYQQISVHQKLENMVDVEQHLHLADMSRPLEAEPLLRRRPSHRLPFKSAISIQFKIFASCQNIKIQLKTKISKHWLAFTWPAGDSDADNSVVEQQKPSPLCPAHLHPQHSKIENFTQNPECQSQYLSSTGCW